MKQRKDEQTENAQELLSARQSLLLVRTATEYWPAFVSSLFGCIMQGAATPARDKKSALPWQPSGQGGPLLQSITS